jgi:hypothetical protein
MLSANWKRLPTPVADMTVTVGNGTPKVIVTDEGAIPDDLCKVTRLPVKTLIKEALCEGREIPGAMLGNVEPRLNVSRR